MRLEMRDGDCWWEEELRFGRIRYCVHRKVQGLTFSQDLPTGWSVGQEDRQDGKWLAMKFGVGKIVVGTEAEAKQFVEVSFALEQANY